MGTKGSMKSYTEFLASKTLARNTAGFKPLWMLDKLFPFQQVLTEWAIRRGRGALLEDCGLGKTPQSLTWAKNVEMKTNGNVLILTPLAVAPQTIREGEKFGIEVKLARDGKLHRGISAANYQMLHKFDPDNYAGVVADESSIIKNSDGKTRKAVTEFLRRIPYRLLCTATPAPNDFMELGTSAEALGIMSRNQMLGMFFANDGETTQQWRLKGHAKSRFWQWVASWARAVRKPSDLGFADDKFNLPPLTVTPVSVDSQQGEGFFPRQCRGMDDDRKERRVTLTKRCEAAADLVPKDRPCVLWCQLNPEGDLLEKLTGGEQVAGSDSDNEKEEKLNAFSQGQIRVLVTKPKIAGWGLNWQHCADMTYFPDWSFEAFYQAKRRLWRFGQKHPVNCWLVHAEAGRPAMTTMLRKERESDALYTGIIQNMTAFQTDNKSNGSNGQDIKIKVPAWLRN